uniref:Uncharacterized protein n=1 Tax=Mustela putorius furo TaxID=9669 RepID=M3Y9K2_MUSPF
MRTSKQARGPPSQGGGETRAGVPESRGCGAPRARGAGRGPVARGRAAVPARGRGVVGAGGTVPRQDRRLRATAASASPGRCWGRGTGGRGVGRARGLMSRGTGAAGGLARRRASGVGAPAGQRRRERERD